jgi:hypothetical protein
MSEINVGEALALIRIEVAKLGEKIDYLKDMPERLRSVERTADESLQRNHVSENRLKALEDHNRWLWRTISGGFIIGAIGIIFAYFKISGAA